MADETPLPNSAEARTDDGTIKDQAPPPTTTETPKETPASTVTETTPPKEETKSTETPKEGDKPKAAEGPPEKYEFKVPEGQKLDDKLIEEASTVFKKHGLSQESAQELVDFYNKQMAAVAQAPLKAFQDIREGWRNDVLKDPKMGNGSELHPEVKATLGRAIDSMGVAEGAAFREAMEMTGAADNPAVVRGLLALGKLVNEGRPVSGAGPAKTGQAKPGSAPSAAQAMYPNLPSSNG